MPPLTGTSPLKSSNSNPVSSNFEDDDEV